MLYADIVEITSVKTIAGGDGFFSYPSGICRYNKAGSENRSSLLYIADMNNKRVCWLTEDGSAGALASDIIGDSSCFSLSRPLAVCVTSGGTLFTVDAELNKIFYKDPNEEFWNPIKIKIEDDNTPLNLPGGIALDLDRNIYVSDFLNDRIVKIDRNGRLETLLWSGEGLSKPYGIYCYGERLYYTDTGNARIGYIDLRNRQVHHVLIHGSHKLDYPIAITLDIDGNIYLCENRSMYFIDINDNTLSLIVNNSIWKELMDKYGIANRICHMGSIVVRGNSDNAEVCWADTVKGYVYLMRLRFRR